MKKVLFVFSPLLLAYLAAATIGRQDSGSYHRRSWKENIIGCSISNEDEISPRPDGKYIGVMPGWGNHHYAISSKSDSAQLYFDQGLSLYYSYHHREATASFKEAARFDSSCAIIYWGEALAMGPSYNGGYSYRMNAEVPDAIRLMYRFAGAAANKEKDLVDAMSTRYNISDPTDAKRAELNKQYAESMKALAEKYSMDNDVKAIYVDAVMLVHPWDFWNNDGTPEAWTNTLVQYCREILAADPHHPAALHYYIHLTEASRSPEVALPCADSLKKLFPGVAHMVHMASHEYERSGDYGSGVQVNDKADSDLGNYRSLAAGLGLAAHASHYFAVATYCAISGAMYAEGMKNAIHARNNVEPGSENTYAQYIFMLPQIARVRLGKWNEILRDSTTIHGDWVYATLLDDFARGMAYSKKGESFSAMKCLSKIKQEMQQGNLHERFTPYESSPYECAEIAQHLLAATINFSLNKTDSAIIEAKMAITSEDKLLYTEPKLWMVPARQYLGAIMLKIGRFTDAENLYREDLVWNPGNPWSLVGLYQALDAAHQTAELSRIKSQYLRGFSNAETVPNTSAY
ncbi:MAG TPA: hypothetical protein VKR32_06415 [Puia sp.]|nr:hypothetical protein [Puia sp.]